MGQNLSSEKRLILIPDDISSFFGRVILLVCPPIFFRLLFVSINLST